MSENSRHRIAAFQRLDQILVYILGRLRAKYKRFEVVTLAASKPEFPSRCRIACLSIRPRSQSPDAALGLVQKGSCRSNAAHPKGASEFTCFRSFAISWIGSLVTL